MAEALDPDLPQLGLFIGCETALRSEQLELPFFLPLRLALRTALAPLAGTLLEGQRLEQAVSTPAEQLLGPLHPAPQCCQTFEVEGC